MSRRRFGVLLGVVGVSVAIALVLGAGGLWAHKSSRGAVNRYIKNVDALQQQMRLPLTHLLTAYRAFPTRAASPQLEQQLAQAELTLQTLERRLSALPAPPPAATLRRMLVKLVEQERAAAREVAQLGRFLPRFDTVVSGSRLANAQLARALAATKSPTPPVARGTPKKIAEARAEYAAAANRAAASQADAIDTYDRLLAHVISRLRALVPPPVMTPTYQTQMHALEATRAAGGALSQELRKQNRSRVPLLSRGLSVAARIAASIASQRAEIDAIKAYDARVQAVNAQQQRVQAEVSRLVTTLQ
jgi:hypothetical protein